MNCCYLTTCKHDPIAQLTEVTEDKLVPKMWWIIQRNHHCEMIQREAPVEGRWVTEKLQGPQDTP